MEPRKPWEIPISYNEDTRIDAPSDQAVDEEPGDTRPQPARHSGGSREDSKANPMLRDESVVDAPPRPIEVFGVDEDDYDEDFYNEPETEE